MKVSELILKLQAVPQDSDVYMELGFWMGEPEEVIVRSDDEDFAVVLKA